MIHSTLAASVLVAGFAAAAFVAVPPGGALPTPSAPTAVELTDATFAAWQAQTALGWQPCRPEVVVVPLDVPGRVAEADNGEQTGSCEVRWSPTVALDVVSWVAWHEVCHLSTMAAIYADPSHALFGDDPPHDHPLFEACVVQAPTWSDTYEEGST